MQIYDFRDFLSFFSIVTACFNKITVLYRDKIIENDRKYTLNGNKYIASIYLNVLTKFNKVKGKVFYGQEPPSGESTTTECGFNYQLLAVIYRSSPMGSSYLQSTTTSYGQWRQRLVAPHTLHRAVSPELNVLHTAMRAGLQITRLTVLREPRSCDLRNGRPTHCLCGQSGYK